MVTLVTRCCYLPFADLDNSSKNSSTNFVVYRNFKISDADCNSLRDLLFLIVRPLGLLHNRTSVHFNTLGSPESGVVTLLIVGIPTIVAFECLVNLKT